MAAVHDALVPAVDACSYDAACLAVREQQTGHVSLAVRPGAVPLSKILSKHAPSLPGGMDPSELCAANTYANASQKPDWAKHAHSCQTKTTWPHWAYDWSFVKE